ncbi:MAG TPA: YbaK/EbsC family protein [Bryobacteraceae bacterium]|nr:YbaK/EbsC family protein [Bryobacteraceae bacterium]
MPVRELCEYLDSNGVKYELIEHCTAFTAQGIAALTHTRGREFAKTVILNMDGELVMVVAPASYHIDVPMLRASVGATSLQLATEAEFRDRFPGCETGAMPPFGNLYGMPVYVDESLTTVQDIAFNAGSHRELMRMSWKDFARLLNPRIVHCTPWRAAVHAA